ncbi:MAG: hypothetical protein VX293_11785, partial [Candidatus Latescibacterota bacterium]|nr:hypothetical protein [Candidatus Latescibacterota bacterium]
PLRRPQRIVTELVQDGKNRAKRMSFKKYCGHFLLEFTNDECHNSLRNNIRMNSWLFNQTPLIELTSI